MQCGQQYDTYLSWLLLFIIRGVHALTPQLLVHRAIVDYLLMPCRAKPNAVAVCSADTG